MANTADTLATGKIIEVTFTGTGADWNHSTDGGFADMMHVKSIIWHPSGADDILVVNEGGVDGPSIVHWKAYADLVSNGSFTSDTTGWTSTDDTLASIAGGQSGNCLRITVVGAAGDWVYQQITGLPIGRKHRFSTYHKNGDQTGLMRLGTTAGGSQYKAFATLDDAAWALHSYTFTVTGATAYISLAVASNTADETTLFDEISMEELPINKQISFGEKGVPLKPYIDISDCTFSDITATKIIFILE